MKRFMNKNRQELRAARHSRVRARVKGTAGMPRLSVFRSLKSMMVQLIDDTTGKTLCAVSGAEVKPGAVEGKAGKVAHAFLIGQALAAKATAKGITKAVFDRGGYRFHGRVAAVAEGARAGGLTV